MTEQNETAEATEVTTSEQLGKLCEALTLKKFRVDTDKPDDEILRDLNNRRTRVFQLIFDVPNSDTSPSLSDFQGGGTETSRFIRPAHEVYLNTAQTLIETGTFSTAIHYLLAEHYRLILGVLRSPRNS